ncbi:MAG: sigma 54-interacting transcriptional regulator [Nitrospirota bacterium]|jgi:DNA-binding NtrC family response regulator/pSer/pThr/pTyr-binding forkhead associated (FHA) protein
MSLLLLIYRDQALVSRHSLQDRPLTIGRGDKAEIPIDDPGLAARHAVVEPDPDGTWTLRLLGGRKVTHGDGLIDEVQLLDGTCVDLGRHQLVVRTGGSGSTLHTTFAPTHIAQAHEVAAQAGGASAPLHLEEVGGRRWAVVRRPLTLGVAKDCDVALSDPTVSRHHCRVEYRDDLLFVTDLGSTNGTYVNGVQVLEALLTPGVRLRLGNTELRLVARRHAGAAASGPPLFHGMVGGSPQMREIYRLLGRIAATDAPVLISGETGTGKELAARAIHNASPRRERPLVVVNCGAIPEELIESELFGHEKGAFTHAVATRDGAFAEANHGTIFLDEIGELPPNVQSTLLRVLEERTFKRVGGNRELRSDFRIVAATNRNLAEEVKEGTFRQDLFFRLYVAPVELPPLRERLDDLPALAEHLLRRDATTGSHPRSVAPEAMEVLRRYTWSGNVRELRNALSRAQLLTDAQELGPEAFSFLHREEAPADLFDLAHLPLQEVERLAIEAHLKAAKGQRRAAAASLGIATSTLYEKLKRYPELGNLAE